MLLIDSEEVPNKLPVKFPMNEDALIIFVANISFVSNKSFVGA